jgi:hypothetical protein
MHLTSLRNITRLESIARLQCNDMRRFQYLLSLIDMLSTEKINRETSELSDNMNKMDLTSIHRAFQP